MLKYSFIANGASTNEEIKFEDFYLSPDLSYISGVTSIEYALSDNDLINLNVPHYKGLYKTYIKTNNVLRQGYVIYNEPYIIKKYVIDGEFTNYIIYNDGKIYYQSNSGTFYVNGKEYSPNGDEVLISTKYWIENMSLTINNVTYFVDPINVPLIKLNNNTILTPIDYKEDKWYYVTKFIIYRDSDKVLNIENITCADYFRYIEYGQETYDVNDENIVKIDNENYTIFTGDTISKNLIDVKGNLCSIKYGWRSSSSGQLLYIFIEDGIIIKPNDIIVISPITSSLIRTSVIGDGSDRYVIYNAKKYIIQKDIKKTIKMIIDPLVNPSLEEKGENYVEYEIFTDENGLYYIMFSNVKNFVEIKGNKCIKNSLVEKDGKVVYEPKEYDIVYYDGIVIDGNKFVVSTENYIYKGRNEADTDISLDAQYIYIDSQIKYRYKVEEVTSSNMLRCSLKSDYNNLTEDENKMEGYDVSSSIFNNPNDYIFTTPNMMFGDTELIAKSGMGNNVLEPTSIADALEPPLESILKIYKISDYISLPVLFETNVSNNLFQEIMLKDKFFNAERKESINRIVDMERDIYVPVYKTDEATIQNFPLIDEIIFNLHFRTRDLSTWKIIEDDGIKILNKDGVEVERPSNWAIYDTPIYKNLSSEDKFNMSDLLYFLDFTDDDVFYQKSKLSKSFLRLSFYDSNDPKVQSLLHTSTIFLNEGDLYLKYINNVNNGEFKNVIDNDKVVVDSDTISVSTEYSKNGTIIFNEEKRLSSRFSVKNRYEEKTSAEGFYLYLFKEYSTNLHERSIYMKVDFNHAGIGRVIPFMLPLNDLGEKETEIDKFKEGYSLNDIYKRLFIELKVVYDEVNKRYVYYTPFKGTNEKLIFNLFEIKIKNE